MVNEFDRDHQHFKKKEIEPGTTGQKGVREDRDSSKGTKPLTLGVLIMPWLYVACAYLSFCYLLGIYLLIWLNGMLSIGNDA